MPLRTRQHLGRKISLGVLLIWCMLQGGTLAFNVLEKSSHGKCELMFPSKSIPSSRRGFLSTAAILSSLGTSSASFAYPFGDSSNDRRQKELCLVNVLRLQYWARTMALKLESSHDIEQRKKAYLEARLGAKAMVAKKQKVGGGATPRVFTLVSLQLIGCLDDLRYYSKYNKKVTQLKEDILESLASIVEFDGLETTQDPSPRSSLTLGQFNEEKALFIQRMLAERVTPLTQELIDYFGPDSRVQCEGYVRQYYSTELPPTQTKTLPVDKSFTTSESGTATLQPI